MTRIETARNGFRRGYFEIGIYHCKTEVNIGTLWRSASQLGASGIFTIGKRYKSQASDTVKASRHIPLREYERFEDFYKSLPYSAELIAVEMGGKPLGDFTHPERGVYLLGAEDNGLPAEVVAKCHRVVSLQAVNTESYNVAVAGSIVMYHRLYG